jgi:hypothetical protein
VWRAHGRFEGGWTIEMAVPFKSIRYTSGEGQTWGIQMRRAIRRKNEWAHLTPLPTVIPVDANCLHKKGSPCREPFLFHAFMKITS